MTPDAITAAADEAFEQNPGQDPPGEIEAIRLRMGPALSTEGPEAA